MGAAVVNFKRTEKKYILTKEQYSALWSCLCDRVLEDKYSHGRVNSLYLDTPDFRLIRNSIYHEGYKEKLRLRCYGIPDDDTKVFFELKKKYNGVVYKRRAVLTLSQSREYFKNGTLPENSQIMRELHYAMCLYGNPAPVILICCDRDAYTLKEDPTLRITFDRNIRFSFDEPDFSKTGTGNLLLPEDYRLMEIKTDTAIPLWLSKRLSENKIFPTPFSKYGLSYKMKIGEKIL